MYGAAGWMAAWPFLHASGVAQLSGKASLEVLGLSTLMAAGAAVIPDLDHPDARPSKHFGILTKFLAKTTNKVSGGHRMATHTVAFGLLLGGLSWALTFAPTEIGAWTAAVVGGMCCSFGVALVGPSLGFRIPWWADWASAIGTGYWIWYLYPDIQYLLPWIAVYGVLIHIMCDAVTKGGVPLLWPLTGKRFALGLFTVGGKGEQLVTIIGILGFIGALWYASASVVS